MQARQQYRGRQNGEGCVGWPWDPYVRSYRFILFAADHDQEHLETLMGLQGMGNIGRHDQHLPGFHGGELATDGDFRLSIQNSDHGVKGCFVLTETLTCIKSK